jgi:hypothetical protein
VFGAGPRGLAGEVQREGEEDEAARPSSGAAAWACEVMRPPNDRPPAKSGSGPASRRPTATAARTAPCATGGGSTRLPPRSM